MLLSSEIRTDLIVFKETFNKNFRTEWSSSANRLQLHSFDLYIAAFIHFQDGNILHISCNSQDANFDQTLFTSTLGDEELIEAEINQTILKLFIVCIPAETLVCVSAIAESHRERTVDDFISD